MVNVNQFRLYPRGFLGDGGNKPVIRRPEVSAATLRFLREDDTVATQFKMLGSPNPDISGLHHDLLTAPNNMERFAWREELLRASMNAFGCDSLSVWVKAQATSPYCGKYHKEFIADCLRFASNGVRHQALSSWNNLLSDDDTGDGGKLPGNDDCGLFNGTWFDKASILDLVRSWVSQDGGYSDMVISLNILFGRYDGLY